MMRGLEPQDEITTGSQMRSYNLTLEFAALALREPAPDSKTLIVLKCILQAFHSDLAPCADLLGLAG